MRKFEILNSKFEFVLLSVFLCVGAINAGSDEWVTSMGDFQHSGVSASTVLRPPLKLKWKTRIFGFFKQQLVIANGKVFAAARNGYITALNAETGSVLWTHFSRNAVQCAGCSYYNGRIFVAQSRDINGLLALDANTGEKLWRAAMNSNEGYGGQLIGPTCSASRVFMMDDSSGLARVRAFNQLTGNVVWSKTWTVSIAPSSDGGNADNGTINGDTLFVMVQGKGVYALNESNGTQIWSNTTISPGTNWNDMTLSYKGGKLYVPIGGNGGSITCLNSNDGSVVWTGGFQNGNIAATLYDDYVTNSGYKSGTVWDVVPLSGCNGQGAVANGYGYAQKNYDNKEIEARRIPDRDVAQTWQFRGQTCPGTSIAYDKLYVSTNDDGMVYCFENAP